MKKLLLLLMVGSALLIALTSQTNIVAYAATEVLQESETASVWSEWLPRIEAIGVSAITIVTIIVMFLREIKTLVGKVKGAVGELKNTDEELKLKSEILERAKAELNAATTELDTTKQEIAQIKDSIDKIVASLNIAFGNNAELVKKGFAKEIAELLGGINEQDT